MGRGASTRESERRRPGDADGYEDLETLVREFDVDVSVTEPGADFGAPTRENLSTFSCADTAQPGIPPTHKGMPAPVPRGTNRSIATDPTCAASRVEAISQPDVPAPSPMGVSAKSGIKPGERIRHFEVISEIGRGGMGQVFLARDLKLGRKVALKVLNSQSDEFTKRLLVEARATVRCSHENIVILYEVGEHNHCPFMVLEHLEGQPLNQLMSAGPITERRALELITPVVRALTRAHELQIVHRDLKPGNIFVTQTGAVKVLDFGIARAFTETSVVARLPGQSHVDDLKVTREEEISGTIPYMAPEQWGVDTIDARTDLWAVGIILWEMLVGRHPLAHLPANALMAELFDLDSPMPRIEDTASGIRKEIAAIINRCLQKPKDRRFTSASELLESLEAATGRRSLRRSLDECPYPGLSAYQEADADRFFGRNVDVGVLIGKLRSTPLVAVVGSSGVGKSSLVRAGIFPALRSPEDPWEIVTIRPGRTPLESLAAMIESMAPSSLAQQGGFSQKAIVDRLVGEPGFLGAFLRAWARHHHSKVLLFVDQFEELYTLIGEQDTRDAFVDCLVGMADDPSTPLRVVLSMRADLLDRATENRRFMTLVSQGLYLLAPPRRASLYDALVRPLEDVGYRFESPQLVEQMLEELEGVDGALPLLQFAASKLWETRDERHLLLTHASYQQIGGIAGALASHADRVIQHLPASLQRLSRQIFARLVTADGTREIIDVVDLDGLSPERQDVRSLLDLLAGERLVVVRTDDAGAHPTVELVHESLVSSWPTLRRWLEEDQEDRFFLEQLRTAAKQWASRGRPKGLLWRGEAMEDAHRFARRYRGDLAEVERAYLEEVSALATQSARRRRRVVAAVILLLLGGVTAAGVALLEIREAEQEARNQAHLTQQEAARARAANEELATQLELVRAKERQRQQAAAAASEAREQVAQGEKELARTNEQLVEAFERAQAEELRAKEEAQKANRAAREARVAKGEVEKLLAAERARLAAQREKNEELRRRLDKLGTTLK